MSARPQGGSAVPGRVPGQAGGAGPEAPLNPDHTHFHPKWHRERVPLTWWTRNRRYTGFILRELTSVLVLYAGVLLVVHVAAAAGGPERHAAFLEWLARPWVIALHLFVLAGLLFHTISWISLAPRAIVVRVGRWRISEGAVLAAHYGAWAAVSAVLALLLVRALGA